MTNRYGYRYVCDRCQAVDYYGYKVCRRCGSTHRTKTRNSEKRIEEIESGKRILKPSCPGEVEHEYKSDAKQDDKDNEDLDDLISDILEG